MLLLSGFPTGVKNMGGGSSKFDGGLDSIHGGAWGLKMLLKNTCERVHPSSVSEVAGSKPGSLQIH